VLLRAIKICIVYSANWVTVFGSCSFGAMLRGKKKERSSGKERDGGAGGRTRRLNLSMA